jgi:hypothetical protein
MKKRLGDEEKRRSNMTVTDEKAIERMRRAITAYTGPVMRCPPGKARASADAAVVTNESVEWLKQHRNDWPVKNAKDARRQMRIVHAQQQRIARRNAAVLKRINKRKARGRNLHDEGHLLPSEQTNQVGDRKIPQC